jgi:hypothetical protein
MAELKVKITSDVAGAMEGFSAVDVRAKQLEANIEKLNSIIANTTSQRKLTSALSALSQQQRAYDQLLKANITTSTQSARVSNQAAFALGNFNRVIQDAPFGLRGIANNIDPLVESFNKLRQSTGSTTGALGAMLRSLRGGAGLAALVSLTTTALIMFGDKLLSIGRSSKEAKDGTDALAASLAEELVQLTTVVGLAQNANASQSDRQKALRLLNEEYGKYLSNLSSEEITLSNIKQKYDEIVDAMIRQAVVKGLQEQIANQVKETAKKIIDLQLAREKERLELEKSNKTQDKSAAIDKKLQQIANDKNKTISDGVLAYQNQVQAERAAIGTTNVYDMMIQGLTESLKNSLIPALNLTAAFKDLNKTLKDGPKGDDAKLNFAPFLEQQDIKVPLRFSDDPIDYKDSISPVGAILKKETEAYFTRTEPLDGSLLLEVDKQKVEEKASKIAEDTKNSIVDAINAALQNIQIEGIASVGEAIGAALTGGDVKSAFVAFGQILADGLETIGKQLISIGALAKITKEALKNLFNNPTLAVVAGIGLVAAASALRTSLSKGVNARALGGPVSGGQPYLVGERGPELFVPSVSGGIVPNNAVGSFMGGGMSSSGGRGSVLRGQDIILAYARTQRSQLRVNG